MKIRILAGTAVLALATGLAALPAGAAAPTATNAYDRGSMADRGTCTGLAIGTYANVAKTAGLTATNQQIAFSGKGVASASADALAVPAVFGACSLQQRLGVTGTPVNFGGINYVNKTVTKFGLKLASASVDCYDGDNESDSAERPLTGKISWTFSDGLKMEGYVRTQGQDRGTAKLDLTWYTGIVAKGEAVGSTIGGNVWVNPIIKDKPATAYFAAGGTYSGTSFLDATPETRDSVAPGYGYSPSKAIVDGVSCQTGTDNGGSVSLGLLGAGFTSPSLDTTSAGWKLLL
jgi:hypothetical protein